MCFFLFSWFSAAIFAYICIFYGSKVVIPSQINEFFSIEIKCDRKTNEYYLSEDVTRGRDSLRDWMISVVQLNGVLNESTSLRDRVLFEGVHSGFQFVETIIGAMKAKVCVLMTYQGYSMEKEEELEIEPWCIKLYDRRWYMLGHDTSQVEEREPHLYMLERASRVKYSLTDFELPASFDVPLKSSPLPSQHFD